MDDVHRNSVDPIVRLKSEHQALAVLRVLSRLSGFASNERLLHDWLQSIGLVADREQLIGLLVNLQRSALLVLDEIDGLTVVRLTAKGHEVARGIVQVDGVLRPPPECPY